MVKIQEYQRTCRHCGKVWHSLVSRERSLSLRRTGAVLGECGSQMQSASLCFMCNFGAPQYGRNADATTSEIDRLRSCPACGSKNYSEKIMTYDQ